jgi:hypothetical protein
MERQPKHSADHLAQDTGGRGVVERHRYPTLCNESVTSRWSLTTSGSSHYTIAEMRSEVEQFGTILCEKCNEARILVTLKDAVL